MADHSLPTTASTYVDVLANIDARLDDMSRWFNTNAAAPTNVVIDTVRWNSTLFKFEKNTGVGTWADLSTRYDININGTVGSTTPAAGAFTTLSSTSTTNFATGATINSIPIVVTTLAQTLTNKTLGTGTVYNGGIITEAYGGSGQSTFAAAPWALKGANTTITSINSITGIGNTAATHLQITSAGTVGIGLNPGTWAGKTGLVLAAASALAFITSGDVTSNTYSNAGEKYYAAAPAAKYSQISGTHSFWTAPSGTINTAITFAERMRIDANGNVGIGAASAGQIFEVTKNQNASTVGVIRNTDAGVNASTVLQLTGGTKYANFTLAPNNGNYLAIQGAGGIVIKYEDFDTHDWRNNLGTSNLTLDSTGNLTARNAIFARSTIQARTTTTTHGFVGLQPGNATNSGYIEFWSHTGAFRQGYIGFSSTNAAENSGTIPYVAATHAFTGNLSVTGTITGTYGGIVAAANGGTGQSSYAVGDLLFASGATALSKLADVATGNALISGGVGVAPAWGKVGLTTHISGTLAVGNGGTNATTASQALINLGAITALTGALLTPVGTTAQRPTAATGHFRFNTTLTQFEGYNGTAWGKVGGGATGGDSDDIFSENGKTVTVNYTITTNKNALSAGPITINSGITVTVPNGSRWVVV